MNLLQSIRLIRQAVDSRIATRIRRAKLARTPYYTRYPYRSPISIFEVDRRVFIAPEMKLFFNGIGKAGHSSILTNLARARYGKEIDIDEVKSRGFLRPSSFPQDQISKLDSYFRFTFVRNPYTRTLSAYLDKVARQKIVPRSLKRISKTASPSFLDFCLYLENGGLFDGVHWAPQTAMMVLPIDQFNFIGKLEKFDDDLENVLQHLGLAGRLQVGRHDPHKTNSDEKRLRYYDERSMEIVRRLFRKDFELLDYSYEI